MYARIIIAEKQVNQVTVNMFMGQVIVAWPRQACMAMHVRHAWAMQLFCHPMYSISYGALMIFMVGGGGERVVVYRVTLLKHFVGSCGLLIGDG